MTAAQIVEIVGTPISEVRQDLSHTVERLETERIVVLSRHGQNIMAMVHPLEWAKIQGKIEMLAAIACAGEVKP